MIFIDHFLLSKEKHCGMLIADLLLESYLSIVFHCLLVCSNHILIKKYY